MSVLRHKPYFQRDDVQTDGSSLGIIVRYMEKTVKLEEQAKQDKEDLQQEISKVRQETADMVDNRLTSLQSRFDSIDEKLEKMKPKEEPPPDDGGQPPTPQGTKVDEVTELSSPPTEIHPPAVPRGIHGRRKYRREHQSQ
jgi:hypothetical protein